MSKAGAGYYEAYYPDYDLQNPPAKLEFYLGLVGRHAAPGATLFELGVGQGLFLREAVHRYRCLGCDINSHGVEQTSRQAPGATLFQGSYETLPRAEADVVVSFDVLEHLPDLGEGLRTIHERLKPGGALVGVVPVYGGPLGWIVRLLDKDPTHVTKESSAFWRERLAAEGFEIVEWGGILRKLFGRRYVHLTGPKWLLGTFNSAIYFVARKSAGRSA